MTTPDPPPPGRRESLANELRGIAKVFADYCDISTGEMDDYGKRLDRAAGTVERLTGALSVLLELGISEYGDPAEAQTQPDEPGHHIVKALRDAQTALAEAATGTRGGE